MYDHIKPYYILLCIVRCISYVIIYIFYARFPSDCRRIAGPIFPIAYRDHFVRHNCGFTRKHSWNNNVNTTDTFAILLSMKITISLRVPFNVYFLFKRMLFDECYLLCLHIQISVGRNERKTNKSFSNFINVLPARDVSLSFFLFLPSIYLNLK